ncbi:electron transfer flavoprotein subunit alpha [Luteitalea sp. TBR-22]|uniref:electron transfer flavoprotein subunit alpha/FixB family protein n=1 Tax=Luteitalea sp. TBR-22 TaxID=2802971 RepID=UPI001AF59A51|nr:electron transfer flavoprotein subunit alpha/FixB family protein [Luteitalea sp. TBR-22]BCS34113.1 electron transfer flavoprotein subunit alpha [Luteitalea sp. TBR-22]
MILVIAEHNGGQVHRATWEAVAAAQALGQPVTIVVAGQGIAAIGASLAEAQVAGVVIAEHAGLADYTADGYVAALSAIVTALSPSLVLAAHTYQARDFMPKLAARCGRGLVSDCVAVTAQGEGYRFTRPVFQARLIADVDASGAAPHFATLQAGAVRADALQKGSAPVETRQVALDGVRQQPEAPFKEAKQAVDLTAAERIVSVGRGIKGPEHLAMVQELAEALGAEVAASRPICDNGWLPMDRQIGSSGQTVAPKLYLALGISGAIQHVVGMKGARTIVAVNKDPEAPIFELADYGIAGDLFEVVPALIAELKK